jgi:hypothetical protein
MLWSCWLLLVGSRHTLLAGNNTLTGTRQARVFVFKRTLLGQRRELRAAVRPIARRRLSNIHLF